MSDTPLNLALAKLKTPNATSLNVLCQLFRTVGVLTDVASAESCRPCYDNEFIGDFFDELLAALDGAQNSLRVMIEERAPESLDQAQHRALVLNSCNGGDELFQQVVDELLKAAFRKGAA